MSSVLQVGPPSLALQTAMLFDAADSDVARVYASGGGYRRAFGLHVARHPNIPDFQGAGGYGGFLDFQRAGGYEDFRGFRGAGGFGDNSRYRDSGFRSAAPIRGHVVRVEGDAHSPRGALWRAAVLPGWGQIYNRQYVKLPFVYGAMGGLIAAIISLDNEYDLYNRAFQYKAYQELVDAGQIEQNPRASFQSSYERIASDVGPVSSRPLEIRRNNLRRGRDLSAIGLGLVYGLAMLDAYVSAHLLDFDIGESLGVSVIPGTDGVRISASTRIPGARE